MRNLLLCLLDRAQPPATEIPARVVVARLLAAHTTTGRTQLGPKATLAAAKPGYQSQCDEAVGRVVGIVEQRGDGRVEGWDGSRGRRQDEVRCIGIERQGRIAVGQELIEVCEGRLGGNRERESGEGREGGDENGGRHRDQVKRQDRLTGDDAELVLDVVEQVVESDEQAEGSAATGDK